MSKDNPNDISVINDFVEQGGDDWSEEYFEIRPKRRRQVKIGARNVAQPTEPQTGSKPTEQGGPKQVSDAETQLELAKKRLELAKRLQVVLNWLKTRKADPNVKLYLQVWQKAKAAAESGSVVNAEGNLSMLENAMRQGIFGGEKQSQGPDRQDTEKGRDLRNRLRAALNWLTTMKADPAIKLYSQVWQNAKSAAENGWFVDAERNLSMLENVMRTSSFGREKQPEGPSSQDENTSRSTKSTQRARREVVVNKDPEVLTKALLWRLRVVEHWLKSIKDTFELVPTYKISFPQAQTAREALEGDRLSEAQDMLVVLERRMNTTEQGKKSVLTQLEKSRKDKKQWDDGYPNRMQNFNLAKLFIEEGKKRNLDWLQKGAEKFLADIQKAIALADNQLYEQADETGAMPILRFSALKKRFNEEYQQPELLAENQKLIESNPNGPEAQLQKILTKKQISERLVNVHNSMRAAGVRDTGLSPGQTVAIYSYTTKDYEAINNMLNGIPPPPDPETEQKLRALAKLAADAMNDLPAYAETDTTRGEKAWPGADEQYKVGTTFTIKAFWSTGIGFAFPGVYQITVTPKNKGKKVEAFSEHVHEAEVLFPPQTSFHVTSRLDISAEKIQVHVKEV
jgi:hypothetical protein